MKNIEEQLEKRLLSIVGRYCKQNNY